MILEDLIGPVSPRIPEREVSGLRRMSRRVTIDAESGCWVCGSTPNGKYALASIGGRTVNGGRYVLGHRLFYAASRGESLADLDARGLCLDHVKSRGCKGGHCVNPAHLEEVTIKENTLRGDGDTADRARRTHCPRGHHLVGANVRPDSARSGYRSCLVCKRAQGRLKVFPLDERTDSMFLLLVADELGRTDKGRDRVAAAALS